MPQTERKRKHWQQHDDDYSKIATVADVDTTTHRCIPKKSRTLTLVASYGSGTKMHDEHQHQEKHEVARLHGMGQLASQFRSPTLEQQPQQQHQQPNLDRTVGFSQCCLNQVLQSMQRRPYVVRVQCLGLHALRRFLLLENFHHHCCWCCWLGTSGTPVAELFLVVLRRALTHPTFQANAAVQRAGTALTAMLFVETTRLLSQHNSANRSNNNSPKSLHDVELTQQQQQHEWMVPALTQILQLHGDDAVIQCNATATVWHILLLAPTVSSQKQKTTIPVHDRPLKDERVQHIGIQSPDKTDCTPTNCSRVLDLLLPKQLFVSLQCHKGHAAVFGNCVCLLTILRQRQQQQQQPRQLSESCLFDLLNDTKNLQLLSALIYEGMQYHEDSLPVQHACVRWLRLHWIVSSASNNTALTTTTTSSSHNPNFTSLVVHAMECFPDAVALQVCATHVLTLKMRDGAISSSTTSSSSTSSPATEAVWHALQRHPRALQMPSMVYLWTWHHLQPTNAAAGRATKAFGGNPENPWTVLWHVWKCLGLLQGPHHQDDITTASGTGAVFSGRAQNEEERAYSLASHFSSRPCRHRTNKSNH